MIAFRSRMRLNPQRFSPPALQAPIDPTNHELEDKKSQNFRPLTSSLELFTNAGKRSNAKSFASGMLSNQGVKLYTPDLGSCSQWTPGLKVV